MPVIPFNPAYSSPTANKRALLLVSRIQSRIMSYFRTRRHRWLVEEFGSCRTVVDIGGRESMWQTVEMCPRVTLVNMEDMETAGLRFDYVRGDGRALNMPDDSFDLAFSNSVIEHVGPFEDQQKFAQEMMRVGRRVYCQTPNRWFPVEFHFLGMFVHWLPRKWFSYRVHRYLTLRGVLAKPSQEQSNQLRSSVRLLTRREMKQLFPGCQIRTERFLGLPKSFVAWR